MLREEVLTLRLLESHHAEGESVLFFCHQSVLASLEIHSIPPHQSHGHSSLQSRSASLEHPFLEHGHAQGALCPVSIALLSLH